MATVDATWRERQEATKHNPEKDDTPGTQIELASRAEEMYKALPVNSFGVAIGKARLQPTGHDLNLDNALDAKIALAEQAVADPDAGLVVDLCKVGSKLSEAFAIAPAAYAGTAAIRRHRDTGDGEVYYFIGGKARNGRIIRPKWSMHFEPGVIMGYSGASSWRTSSPVQVPPIPAQHRPENLENHYIVWEQNWGEKILAPKDPALLEHVVGDVYMVHAVWDLTELEAAALRGKR